MAVSYTCDGCGAGVLAGRVKEYGFVLKRVYCQDCEPKIVAYLAALDRAHTDAAAEFAAARVEAALDVRLLLPFKDLAKLPDEE